MTFRDDVDAWLPTAVGVGFIALGGYLLAVDKHTTTDPWHVRGILIMLALGLLLTSYKVLASALTSLGKAAIPLIVAWKGKGGDDATS